MQYQVPRLAEAEAKMWFCPCILGTIKELRGRAKRCFMDTSRILKTALICSWPLVIFAFNYFTGPVQWKDFVKNPTGQLLLGGALFLLILGALALLFIQIGWLRKLAFVLLIGLPSIVFIIGPTLLTILQALKALG